MKHIIATCLILVLGIMTQPATAQQNGHFKARELYRSKALLVTQVAANSYIHTSFLQTNDFGNVPCNGLVVRNGNEAIVFDTPTNDTGTALLLQWVKESLQCKIVAIVPTHFHNDCLGGLQAFHDNGIPSYANALTIELAKQNKFVVPQNSFTDSLSLRVGAEPVVVQFFGEGHTRDNVVGYFAKDRILFGGCLIKELKATKGFLGDANVAAWSGTVDKVKAAYPAVRIVIPGHGQCGNQALLDYTIQLFNTP